MADNQDDSLAFLNTIFDYTGAMGAIAGEGTMEGGAIATMFETYNAFAMVAVGLIMLYIWSVAVMHTAWEGQALGERYSTLWTPIRSVMAVVFVAPFPGLGGLSILQAIIVSVTALSIMGGNTLYEHELAFFEANNGSLMPLGTENATPDRSLVTAALAGQVCVEYMNASAVARNPLELGQSFSRTVTRSAFEGGEQLTVRYGVESHGEDCGVIKVVCENTEGATDSEPHQAICRAKQRAVEQFTAGLPRVVEPFLAEGGAAAADTSVVRSAMQDAVDAYRSAWAEAVASNENITRTDDGLYMIDLSVDQKQQVGAFVQQAKSDGWLSAGKWYWLLSSYSLEQQNLSKAETSVQRFNEERIPNYKESMVPLMAQINEYLAVIEIDMGDGIDARPLLTSTESGGDQSKAEAMVSRIWADSWGTGWHAWTEALEGDNDPIRTLAGYGQYMITGGWAIIGSAALAKVGSAWSGSVWGKVASFFTGGASSALAGFASFVGSIMLVFAAFLIGTGGLLAYYVPLIPYVFWVLAVLGWAVMFFGSMLAAPLWAASHSVPEGEGFAGRYALQGWQLLVNVAMRPILMVIGLLISMFVMHAIVKFALDGYAVFNRAMVNSTSTSAITGIIFTNVIMTALVIVLSHKAHELIYDIADEVMKWIGFGVQPLGSVKSEGEIKGMAKTTSGTTERLTGAAMGRLTGAGDDGSTGGGGGRGGGGGGGSSGGRNAPATTRSGPPVASDVSGGTDTTKRDRRDL